MVRPSGRSSSIVPTKKTTTAPVLARIVQPSAGQMPSVGTRRNHCRSKQTPQLTPVRISAARATSRRHWIRSRKSEATNAEKNAAAPAAPAAATGFPVTKKLPMESQAAAQRIAVCASIKSVTIAAPAVRQSSSA